jgi:cell volume regulation protein A
VPIVFATFPIVEGVPEGRRIFDVVFYVVVVSLLVQGVGLRPVARRLGLADGPSRLRLADIDVATLRSLGAELVEIETGELGTRAGRTLRDTRLPAGGVVAAIRRGATVVQPRGETELQPGDQLFLLVDRRRLREVEQALAQGDGPVGAAAAGTTSPPPPAVG